MLGLSLRVYIDNDSMDWLKGKDVASSLGYVKPRNAILTHVAAEYKTTFKVLLSQSECLPQEPPNSVWVSEPGVFSLVFSSKLENVKSFQKWLFEDVLPSIRRQCEYKSSYRRFNSPNKLVFKIENEADLHKKVVEYLRRSYPNAIMIAGLGELQDTKNKHIESYMKG